MYTTWCDLSYVAAGHYSISTYTTGRKLKSHPVVNITFGGGQKYDVQCISTFFIFQRSADDLSAILDEAILAHSFGAMDVKTCGDKVLCEIFIPKESLYDALPQRSSHTLRNFVQEKFRYVLSSLQSSSSAKRKLPKQNEGPGYRSIGYLYPDLYPLL